MSSQNPPPPDPYGEPRGDQPPSGDGAPPSPPASPYGEPQPYGGPGPYGEPNPYGRPNPAGQPPPYGEPQPYGQAPGGAPPNPYLPTPRPGRPGRPTFRFTGLAPWITRVGAAIIDSLLGLLVATPYVIATIHRISTATTVTDANGFRHLQTHTTTGDTLLTLLGGLLYLAFFIWNWCVRQGRTGATYGKSVLAIRVVDMNTMQPIGAGMSFLRQLTHILDALPCYLGYLWPLWDSRNQTFSDKIMGTVVIYASEPTS